MNRRRDALKETLKALQECGLIFIMMAVLVTIMVLYVPIGIVWIISPTLGDKLNGKITMPMVFFLVNRGF